MTLEGRLWKGLDPLSRNSFLCQSNTPPRDHIFSRVLEMKGIARVLNRRYL
jgi:hypothetical protein